MSQYRIIGALRFITDPIMVAVWFGLALLFPLGVGYLNTQARYVVDIQLLFYVAVSLLAVAWLMNLMLMPMLKTTLILPLLGIVSFVSMLSDVGNEIYYWAAFQWSVPWLDAALHIVLAIIFVVLVRDMLKCLADSGMSVPRHIWLALSTPFLVLLAYDFFSSHNYFADLHGRVPVFHQGLSAWTLPDTETETIAHFLNIGNSN